MSGSISRFALLVSKFRGCLVGSLVGDCMGALTEVQHLLSPASATSDIQFAANSSVSQDGGLPYTQQTRILHRISESLLHSREFNKADLVDRLVQGNAGDTLFQSLRGSGQHRTVAASGPARLEHLYSVNGPLQTVPFALFYYGDTAKTVEAAKEYTSVWQSGPDEKSMSLLYCLATHTALQFDPIQPLNVDLYLDRLMSSMAEVEAGAERSNRSGLVMIGKDKPSLRKLEIVREVLRTNLGIGKTLTRLSDAPGHVSAAAAIYVFLRTQQWQKDAPKANPIELGLREASATTLPEDFLASLSCALIGAFHGIEAVPMDLRKQCQGVKEAVNLGDHFALKFECQPSGVVDRKEISFVERV